MITNRKHTSVNGPKMSLITRLTGPIVAFNQAFAGTPLTKQERNRANIAEARCRAFNGPFI